MSLLRSKCAVAICVSAYAAVAMPQAWQQPGEESSIAILKLSPPISTVLQPGERVTFEVEIEYSLGQGSGRAALVVQRAERDYSPLGYTEKPLARGKGTTTLSVDVEIPVTRNIQIFLPLYTEAGQATSIVDGRVYEVARR